ncbi:MAG: T9SS type A sorting domain-containing protein [Bacteroidetes bacterium]|nr:T9SS type A sorting domain-containing protein [Bacteroidota bacterium]
MKFEITLILYRDCNDDSLSNSKTINFNCTLGNTDSTFSVSLSNTSINDITTTCKGLSSTCTPSNTPSGNGLEEHIYKGIVDFNSGILLQMRNDGCCRFRLSYGECCRNSYITTLDSIYPFFIDAEIDICNLGLGTKKGVDNSPEFITPPISYICCNNKFIYDPGIIDNDGDSLAISLITPKSQLSTNVKYNSIFRTDWPMTTYCRKTSPCPCRPGSRTRKTEGFCFDPERGSIDFSPTDCNEVGVLCLKVEQFRWDSISKKYLYIGFTIRDVQLRVGNCDNNPPVLSDVSFYNTVICEGEKSCFQITAEDEVYTDQNSNSQSWIDTMSFTWTSDMQGVEVTVGPYYFDTSNFSVYTVRKIDVCWQTKEGDSRNTGYKFILNARDNACPTNALTSKTYQVKVKERARSERIYTKIGCNQWMFESNPKANILLNEIYHHSWIIKDASNDSVLYQSSNRKDSVKFAKIGGPYIVYYTINNTINCENSYVDTIFNEIDFEYVVSVDTMICKGDSIPVGTNIYKTSGNYIDTLKSSMGCDSIVKMQLTVLNINDINDKVLLNNGVLTAVEDGDVSYQWILCDTNSSIIPGEVGRSFEPKETGFYAVLITSNKCPNLSRTSTCYFVKTISVRNPIFSDLKIFPNPTSGIVRITSSSQIHSIVIRDYAGKQIAKYSLESNEFELDMKDFARGVYFIELFDMSGLSVTKIISKE